METGRVTDSALVLAGSSLVGTLARLAIGIILLIVLTQLVDAGAIWTAFLLASVPPLIMAAALLTCNLGFQILKWNYLLRLRIADVSWRQTITSFLFGMTLGLLSPGQLGEFGGRAWRWEGQSPHSVVGLTIIDRMQALFIIGIGGLSSTAWIFLPHTIPFLAAVVFPSLLLLLLFFNPRMIRKLLVAVGTGRLKFRWTQDFLESLDNLNTRQLFVMFFLTTLFYLSTFLQLHFLVNAFYPTTFAESFLGFSAMMLYKTFLPISLGDLGVREATSVFVFSLLDIPKAAVFNASLLLFVLNILLPAIIGLLFLPPSSRIFPRRQSEGNA